MLCSSTPTLCHGKLIDPFSISMRPQLEVEVQHQNVPDPCLRLCEQGDPPGMHRTLAFGDVNKFAKETLALVLTFRLAKGHNGCFNNWRTLPGRFI